MSGRWRRILLLVLIACELFAAAVILHWLFPGRDLASPAAGAPAVGPGVGSGAPRPTARPVVVSLAADLPPDVEQGIRAWLNERRESWTWTGSGPELTIDWQKRAGAQRLARSVLVPVAPFSTRDNVSLNELRRAWTGRPRAGDAVAHLLVPAGVATALDGLLGRRPAEAAVTVVPLADLPARLAAEPGSVAIVPFDHLEPYLQVLAVDGMSALDRSLEEDHYPLLAGIWAHGSSDWSRDLASRLASQLAARNLDSNRHMERLTVLAMTGVTALTRGVALQIEARGDAGWPARRVADLLAAADLTHISNEVSFVPGCQADADPRAFCARPEYMEVLRLVGADVVELTGNHNLDWGAAYALQSLDLYAREGLHTFGGGRNQAEAREPLLIVHNGNRLAFLGYNQFGPDYAWAGEDSPGAARFSLEAVRADVAAVRAQADLVLVNVQYTETYQTEPLPQQVRDFRAIVDAGADVVTGSQAHQPQSVEFYAGKPIFYGLGNLFFDQTWSTATCQGLIVRYGIYEGRLIAVEMIPTTMDDDLQSYPAGEAERAAIFREILK